MFDMKFTIREYNELKDFAKLFFIKKINRKNIQNSQNPSFSFVLTQVVVVVVVPADMEKLPVVAFCGPYSVVDKSNIAFCGILRIVFAQRHTYPILR